MSQLLDCVVWTVHAAPRRPFSRRNQPAIWFQLANVWLATDNSNDKPTEEGVHLNAIGVINFNKIVSGANVSIKTS